VKVDYINPFLTASKKIIKSVLRLEMNLGNLSVKEEQILNDIFVVIIGVSGDFRGRVMFCIKREVACNIASIMMCKTINKMDDVAQSAVGELANMILGRSGIIFSNKGIKVNISPPTIIQGKKLTITPLKDKIVNIPLMLSNNSLIDIEIEVTSA
jgi:chemotaxis protein CheX